MLNLSQSPLPIIRPNQQEITRRTRLPNRNLPIHPIFQHSGANMIRMAKQPRPPILLQIQSPKRPQLLNKFLPKQSQPLLPIQQIRAPFPFDILKRGGFSKGPGCYLAGHLLVIYVHDHLAAHAGVGQHERVLFDLLEKDDGAFSA
jgi:hypothetical protein